MRAPSGRTGALLFSTFSAMLKRAPMRLGSPPCKGDGKEQNARNAKFLHVGCGLPIVADDAPALMHEDQDQEQPARG
jgi:hypothetical protein